MTAPPPSRWFLVGRAGALALALPALEAGWSWLVRGGAAVRGPGAWDLAVLGGAMLAAAVVHRFLPPARQEPAILGLLAAGHGVPVLLAGGHPWIWAGGLGLLLYGVACWNRWLALAFLALLPVLRVGLGGAPDGVPSEMAGGDGSPDSVS